MKKIRRKLDFHTKILQNREHGAKNLEMLDLGWLMEKKPLTWVHYTAIGTGSSATLSGLIVGGYFLGSFMDRKLGSDPLWTLVAILAAIVLSFAYLILMIGKLDNSTQAKGKSEDDES